MNREALIALRDAVKAGRWWDDLGIAGSALAKAGVPDRLAGVSTAAFHGSLDAAKALHEAVLPGWEWNIGPDSEYVSPDRLRLAVVWPRDVTNKANVFRPCGRHASDARAWLLAILEALIAGTPE